MADEEYQDDGELDPLRHSLVLPEGCIPMSVVECVEYLDEDGDRAYAFRFPCDSNYSTVLGLLELVKAQVVHSYFDDD